MSGAPLVGLFHYSEHPPEKVCPVRTANDSRIISEGADVTNGHLSAMSQMMRRTAFPAARKDGEVVVDAAMLGTRQTRGRAKLNTPILSRAARCRIRSSERFAISVALASRAFSVSNNRLQQWVNI